MKQNRRDKKNLCLLLIVAVSLVILIYCVIKLSVYSLSGFYNAKQVRKLRELVGESSVELAVDEATGMTVAVGNGKSTSSDGILDKYRELYNRNQDMIGWIKIEGTKVDFPVMQTLDDEEYYLHRDFEKNEINEGLPFVDVRCDVSRPSTNLLIFGHNMKNGSMFADLLKYEDKEFFEEHRFIRFDSVYEEGLYEVLFVFRSYVALKNEEAFRFYNFIDADTKAEFDDYIENCRKLQLYDTDSIALGEEKLITLITCERSVEDGRFVVVARKIPD